MGGKPLISIITVSYNSEGTIRDTIESVLSQNMSSYEHIIVDGASKDKTVSIVKEYESQYNGRLKWISEPDEGLYYAMNKGIAIAEGDIVGILNSDDFYAHDRVLEIVLDSFKKGKRFVYGDLHIVDKINTDEVLRVWKPGSGKVKTGWILPHPTLYISKKIYNKVGDYDTNYTISADYDMIIRCLHEIDETDIEYIPNVFVKMRSGGESNNGIKSILYGIKQIDSILRKNNMPLPIMVNLMRLIKKANQFRNKG